MKIPVSPAQAYELANQDVAFGITPGHINALRSLAFQVESLTIERDAYLKSSLMFHSLLETEIKARLAAHEAEAVYRIMCEEAKPLLDERAAMKAEVQKLRSQCEGAEIVRSEAVKIATECKADAGRWRRLANASEIEFPIAAIAEDPENDAAMIYGRKHLENFIDGLDEIPEFYAAMQAAKDAK